MQSQSPQQFCSLPFIIDSRYSHPPDDAKQAVEAALKRRDLLQVGTARRQLAQQQQRLVPKHLLLSQQVHEASHAQRCTQDRLHSHYLAFAAAGGWRCGGR